MTKVSKEDIYLQIMQRYPGLIPDVIADMNPYVQHILIRGPRIQEVSEEQFLALARQQNAKHR